MGRVAGLFLLLTLARCGGGGAAAPVTPPVVDVHPGTHHVTILSPGDTKSFRPGMLNPGDVFVCRADGHLLHVRVRYVPGTGESSDGFMSPDGERADLTVSGKVDGSFVARCTTH